MTNEMTAAMKPLQRLIADTKAVTAIEYGLISALIFLAIVSGVTTVQSHVVTLWALIASKI